MKRLYDFITKANQVLLFVAVAGLVGFIGYEILSSFFQSWHGPHVPIAQTPEETKKIRVEDVGFLGKRGDTYVFLVSKTAVEVNTRGHEKFNLISSASFGSGWDGVQGVNVAFTQDAKLMRTLLPSDGLVLYHELASRPSANVEFRFHRFRCVTEDTNGDQILDNKDRTDLYLVSEDAKSPNFVIRGAAESTVLTSTVLLVKVVDPAGIHFLEVDCEARTEKEIAWQ